jgi:hypothetical protein
MEPVPEKIDGAVIVRDSRRRPIGEVTSGQLQYPLSDKILGVFLDDAQDFIPIPPPIEEVLMKRWELVVRYVHAVGLTVIHDALLGQDWIDPFHKRDK